MIFTCDNCQFVFRRTTDPERCPDCGKYAVRLANEAEQKVFGKRLNALVELQYRDLSLEDLRPELFRGFIRHQAVTKCWRRENGQWTIKDAPFIDDWSEQDYQTLISCLKNTVSTGGFVHAAFAGGVLKGFVSVESAFFGGEHKYLDLSSIHVSEEMRGSGIGTRLFSSAKEWARQKGARKLYISAHSAVESQAFYHKHGCTEAQLYHQSHVDAEPFDCQLECVL
ncbi:MAG: GNAT family N-acetyltransferase [Oscillospiraceae bacterium]|nr:GNAT family N-acetyltransferase [Oscillospiraceae bacterium]